MPEKTRIHNRQTPQHSAADTYIPTELGWVPTQSHQIHIIVLTFQPKCNNIRAWVTKTWHEVINCWWWRGI
jgi:hypothetical protein